MHPAKVLSSHDLPRHAAINLGNAVTAVGVASTALGLAVAIHKHRSREAVEPCSENNFNNCEIGDKCALGMDNKCHSITKDVPHGKIPEWNLCSLNENPLVIDARTVAKCVFDKNEKCMYRHFIRYPSILHFNRFRVRRELSCTQDVADRFWWRVDSQISKRMKSKTFAVVEYMTYYPNGEHDSEFMRTPSHFELLRSENVADNFHVMTVFLYRTKIDERWSVAVSDPNHYGLWGKKSASLILETSSKRYESMKRSCDELVKKLTAQSECLKIKMIAGAAPNRFGQAHCFTSVCLNMILLCRCSEEKFENGAEAINEFEQISHYLNSAVKNMNIHTGEEFWNKIIRPMEQKICTLKIQSPNKPSKNKTTTKDFFQRRKKLKKKVDDGEGPGKLSR